MEILNRTIKTSKGREVLTDKEGIPMFKIFMTKDEKKICSGVPESLKRKNRIIIETIMPSINAKNPRKEKTRYVIKLTSIRGRKMIKSGEKNTERAKSIPE
jgi:hypothetical protein